MSRRGALAGLVMCGLLAACGGGEPVNCTPMGSPSAQVGGGTGSTGFVVLDPGDPMAVTLGPQGLYMVTPSVRVQNMYPGQAGRIGDDADPVVEFSLELGGDNIGGSARENLGLTVTADGAEVLGVFTPFTPDLYTYINQLITVRVEVEDACGGTASASLDVIAEQ